MTVPEDVLQRIVGQIVQTAKPDTIILFGSAATGTMTADSDLDFLVVESQVSDTRRESVRIRAALSDVPLPIDIIVMSRQWFDETKDVVGGIAYPAHRYGKVLYEAA